MNITLQKKEKNFLLLNEEARGAMKWIIISWTKSSIRFI